MTASSTYGRAVDVPMVNKSGAGVVLGDAVIYDTTNNDAFTTTTSTGSTLACGIAQETIANNGTGRIRTLGYTSLATPTASVTRGHYGYIGGVAKQVTDAGASRVAGTFLYFLSGGTTPDAIIYPVDLAGAALTNPMSHVGAVIIGGAAGAPTELVIGAAGGALTSLNGTAAYNSGTSFPGSKATGDRYWRTDLGREAYWDGSQWLSTTLYHLPILPINGIGPADVLNGTQGAAYRAPVWNGVYDLYLVDFYGMTFVSTTNTSGAFWTLTLYKETKGAAYSTTSIVSFSTGTGPDTASEFIAHTVSINALMGTGSGTLLVGAAKTSTPGNLTSHYAVTYRLVLT